MTALGSPFRFALDRFLHVLDRRRRAFVVQAADDIRQLRRLEQGPGRRTTASPAISASSSVPGSQPLASRIDFGMTTRPLPDDLVVFVSGSSAQTTMALRASAAKTQALHCSA
jgi:hypothetical protein